MHFYSSFKSSTLTNLFMKGMNNPQRNIPPKGPLVAPTAVIVTWKIAPRFCAPKARSTLNTPYITAFEQTKLKY